ncbi:hypothetical protein D1641_03505 [Colidextribacter sp. OB.20]|uniref:hypothetical protein n=1 Tax=Colidextribacter sp. OB.20 TaxID=2304568 RepID=UPI0013714456|nr:hypothetical protein [Colidextribacter sp. OB.20]NBI09088.1 hypothetical protein [Colidextribacter sp. OB.20]
MDEKKLLVKLEEPLERLHCGIKAIELMTLGMKCEEEPYADGFRAAWEYLQSAETGIREALELVKTEE